MIYLTKGHTINHGHKKFGVDPHRVLILLAKVELGWKRHSILSRQTANCVAKISFVTVGTVMATMGPVIKLFKSVVLRT
jgi:hypothetical protein